MLERKFFRKRRNWLAASILEFASPAMRWCARRQTGETTPAQTWRKGLLIGAHHIGDILYRTSSLPHLAKAFPHCTWDIIAPWPSSELLTNNPFIRKCWNPPGSKKDVQQLSRESYDVLVSYDTNNNLSALKLGIKLGIPNRVGYAHKGCGGLVTHPCPIDFPNTFPAYFRHLVEHLAGTTFPGDLRPLVYPLPGHREKAHRVMVKHHLTPGGYVVLFVSSRQPSGVCPADVLVNCMKNLIAEVSLPVVLAGAKSEDALLNTVANAIPTRAVLAGSLSLLELVEFLRDARLVLTTDSGPRHLANAAGVPVAFTRNIYARSIETGRYVDSELDLIPPAIECHDADEERRHFLAIQNPLATKRLLDFISSHPV